MAIEATYGWYWAVDALQDAGVNVHLVALSKLTAFDGRRVKNDQRDCKILGDLLRANMVPEAWISTPEVREWRELVCYRAKLVAMRSSLKAFTPTSSSWMNLVERWFAELTNKCSNGQRTSRSLRSPPT